MQDTHQTHAMEFAVSAVDGELRDLPPEPAKIAAVTADNVLQDRDLQELPRGRRRADARTGEKYNQPKRAPALTELWAEGRTWPASTTIGVDLQRLPQVGAGVAPDVHRHTTAATTRRSTTRRAAQYADVAANKVAIDAVTLTGNVLDVKFSAANTAIVPTLTISFYGYDAKNMLVSSHTRDAGAKNCYNDRVADPPNAPRSPAATSSSSTATRRQVNRLYHVQADSDAGCLARAGRTSSKYVQPANTGLADIPTLISTGKVKKAEIVVMPNLENADGEVVAIPTVEQTFDLASAREVADYFQGTKAIVERQEVQRLPRRARHDVPRGLGYGGNITTVPYLPRDDLGRCAPRDAVARHRLVRPRDPQVPAVRRRRASTSRIRCSRSGTAQHIGSTASRTSRSRTAKPAT